MPEEQNDAVEPRGSARGRTTSIAAPLAVLGAILIVNALWAAPDARRPIAWLLTLAGLIGLVALIGAGLNCRPAGILIDNRNRLSLSKLQALSWTVLIVSALVTIIAARLLDVPGAQGPIAIDGNVLAAMGISFTSLVATPAILSLKTGPAGTSRLFERATPIGARWADLFRGDEVANAATPDLSKIQQFLISLVVLGSFAFSCAKMMAGAKLALPRLGEDMVWLLGVSHAGYLSYKAVPHAPAADAAASDGLADPRQAPAG